MIKMSDEYTKLLKTIITKRDILLIELNKEEDNIIFSNLRKDLLYIDSFDKYNVKDLEIIDNLLNIMFRKMEDIKNIYKNNTELSDKDIMKKIIEYYKKIIENKIKEQEFLIKVDDSLEIMDEYARLKDYIVYLEYISENVPYSKLRVVRDYEINQIEKEKSKSDKFLLTYKQK